MEDSKDRLLVSDITTFFLCLFYAAVEFSLYGKRLWTIAAIGIDRGMVMGIAFMACAAAIPVLIFLLSKSQNIFWGWIRIFYPMFIFGLFFGESIHMSNIIYSGRSFDAIYAGIDEWIFGFQPSLVFWEALPQSRLLTETLFLSYFSYYLIMAGGCWIAYFRKDRRFAIDSFVVLSTAIYIMYIFYIFYPVMGPKYYFPELHSTWYSNFNGLVFTELMKVVFNNMTLSGAAFPSCHAAISILALIQTFKYSKPLGLIFLPFVVLLLFSTVYIYAHYAIDTIVGMIVGVLLYLAVPWVASHLANATRLAESRLKKIMAFRRT